MVQEDKLLVEAVKRLVKALNVKGIILFGSRARGDWKPWSDYDLLIIADFKERYLDRIKHVLDIIGDIPLSIEPHPYTLSEAIEKLMKGSPLIVDALEEGLVLYSTDELRELVEKYVELKKRGLRRAETTIILPRK